MDIPNSRAIAEQLLQLSQDPENQPHVAKEDGVLAGLTSYCIHPDRDISAMAARTLQFLSSHPQNKRLMKEFPGLTESLTCVFSDSSAPKKTREFAKDALENLGVALLSSTAKTMGGFLEKYTDLSQDYQTTIVKIDGLEDFETNALVRRVLVNVNGVISVSLDKSRNVASVGNRVKDQDGFLEKLIQALATAGVSSSRVGGGGGVNGKAKPMKEEEEDENVAPSNTSFSFEKDDDSGYLDEAEYRQEKGTSALARWGTSSLEARLEQEKREEELRAQKTDRLLTKVSTVLTSASSWLMGW